MTYKNIKIDSQYLYKGEKVICHNKAKWQDGYFLIFFIDYQGNQFSVNTLNFITEV